MKKFKRKLLLIGSISIFPFLTISCANKENTVLNYFSKIAENKEEINNSYNLSFAVWLDRKSEYFTELMKNKEFEINFNKVNDLGLYDEQKNLISYDLKDILNFKKSFINAVNDIKKRIVSYNLELTNSTITEEEKEKLKSNIKKNRDYIIAIQNTFNAHTQNNLRVVINIKNKYLNELTVYDFLELDSNYLDKSISFKEFLKTKIPNFEINSNDFEINFLYPISHKGNKTLFNVNYLFDLYPHFNIFELIINKKDLINYAKIIKNVSDNIDKNHSNIDEKGNLITKEFYKPILDNKKGIIGFGDAIFIKDFEDLTILAATEFFITGFKKI
ncbi:hypothetical protein [Mycoplasmopsis alligatoris]|nr:hypothetical protein [Mycoplasmopsis alligatoris]